jgi:hypothetical protein
MSPDGRATYLLRPTRLPPPLGTSIWLDAARQSYLAQEATGSRQAMLFRRRPDGHVDVLLGGQEAAAGHRQVLTSGMGGAAFGPDGAFYFRHGAVLRKFSPQGRLVTLATDLPQENYGIAVGPDLAVYVAEFAAHRVVRIGHDGRRTIALTASGPWAPTGVAVRGGALYVLETRQLASGATAEIRVRKLAPGAPSVMLAAVPFS